MSTITWGVDGFGRCHICRDGEWVILFSGLPGISGKVLVWVYEEFGPEVNV